MKRLQTTLPKRIGNDAVRHFRKGFRLGGFEDARVEMWKLPKRKEFETKVSKSGKERKVYTNKGFSRADRTRATLVGGGDLRSSVRVLDTKPGLAIIGSDLPYARIHNEGGKLGRGSGKMPKRKFVGHSQNLTKALRKKISFEVLKALKI